MRYWRKLSFGKAKKRNILYFVFEPDVPHPGLADRLKAVISLYNVAKAHGYDFKFYFETPFHLSDYLTPKYDWQMSLDELEYSLSDTKIINETNWHKISSLTPNKQYHCYNYAGNCMPWRFEDSRFYWHELFQELFQPSKLLRQAYEALNITDKHYVSIQFRFVNALELFEGYTFFDNHLETEEERQLLIQKCRNCIKDIIAENAEKTIYVFSDSKTFLDAIEDMPVKVLNHEYLFNLTGEKVLFNGFLAVYEESSLDDEEKIEGLPEFTKGEVLELIELHKEQKFTAPPYRYTEARLIRKMEELGIGRPSTYALTMETLRARGYVSMEKRTFVPTPQGRLTVEQLEKFFSEIINVKYTAEMENTLDEIAAGKTVWYEERKKFYDMFAP